MQEAIKFLAELDAIVPRGASGAWETTPKGKAWVTALCAVPVPRAAYLDQAGEILWEEA